MTLLKGWRTLIVARVYALSGAALGLYDFAADYLHSSGVDIAPILPERFRPYVPAGMVLTGMVFEGLRHITNTPAKSSTPLPPVPPNA